MWTLTWCTLLFSYQTSEAAQKILQKEIPAERVFAVEIISINTDLSLLFVRSGTSSKHYAIVDNFTEIYSGNGQKLQMRI